MIKINEKTVLENFNVFNNDTSFRKLKEKYSAPSFFEIVDISRDETIHSAFLKWLLQGTEIVANKQFIPLMGLLDALIERVSQRDEKIIKPKVKNAIASRSITISNIKAKCEQSIGKLGVIENSKDRIDIYIVCDVEGIDGIDQFEIVIENKINSKEGTSKDIKASDKRQLTQIEEYYNQLTQTERYYLGTDYKKERAKDKDGNDIYDQNNNKIVKKTEWINDVRKLVQFYVFLTPISSYKLSNYSDIDISDTCICDSFIHINYQDIVNHIIDPLLDSENQSAKVRILLEQYMKNLSMPYLEDGEDEDNKKSSKKIIMATQRSDKDLIRKFWTDYEQLIKYSICLHEDVEIKGIPSRQDMFISIIQDLITSSKNNSLEKGIVTNRSSKSRDKINIDTKSYYVCKVNTTTQNTKITGPNKTFLEIIKGNDCFADLVLLYNFYEKNQTLILSALNILSNEDNNQEIRELYDTLTNNSTPKYVVILNNDVLNDKENGKPKGKNLHEVIIAFVENVTKEYNKERVIEFFKGIKNGFAADSLNDIKDKTRFDVYNYNKDNDSFKWVCRADNYTEKGEQNIIIVSTQWGSLDGEKGTFDKFLNKIKENNDFHNDFQVIELSVYLENNNNPKLSSNNPVA